jgi:hypothetical protein
LPQSVRRADGSLNTSGTEFEFEDSIAANRKKGMPVLIVYRNMAEPIIGGKSHLLFSCLPDIKAFRYFA